MSAIRDYPQLVATLENIVKSSQGASTLAYAPYPAKGSGRLVPYVTIGNGPRKMMVVAQQHGDECHLEQRHDLPDPGSFVERQGGKVHPG